MLWLGSLIQNHSQRETHQLGWKLMPPGLYRLACKTSIDNKLCNLNSYINHCNSCTYTIIFSTQLRDTYKVLLVLSYSSVSHTIHHSLPFYTWTHKHTITSYLALLNDFLDSLRHHVWMILKAERKINHSLMVSPKIWSSKNFFPHWW